MDSPSSLSSTGPTGVGEYNDGGATTIVDDSNSNSISIGSKNGGCDVVNETEIKKSVEEDHGEAEVVHDTNISKIENDINNDNGNNNNKEDGQDEYEENEEDVYASILTDIHQIKTEDVDELLLSTAAAATPTADSAADVDVNVDIHLVVDSNNRNETKSSFENTRVNSVDDEYDSNGDEDDDNQNRLKQLDKGLDVDGVSKFQNQKFSKDEEETVEETVKEGDGVHNSVHKPLDEPCIMKEKDVQLASNTADVEIIIKSPVESTVEGTVETTNDSNNNNTNNNDTCNNGNNGNNGSNGNEIEQKLQTTKGDNDNQMNDDNGALALTLALEKEVKEEEDDYYYNKQDEMEISKDFELLRLNHDKIKSKNPTPASAKKDTTTTTIINGGDVNDNNQEHVEDDAKSYLSQSTISTSPSLYHSQLDMNEHQPPKQAQQSQSQSQQQSHLPISQHIQHSQQPQDNAQLVTDDDKDDDKDEQNKNHLLRQPKQTTSIVLPPNIEEDNLHASILNTTNDNDISYDESINSTNFRNLQQHYENLLSKQQQEHTKQIDDILLQLSSIESTYHDEINKLKTELSKKEVMCDALTASLSDFKRRNTTLEKDVENSTLTCSDLEYKLDDTSVQLQEANREIIALRQHFETLRISSEKEKQEAVSFAQHEIQTQAETQFAIAQKKYIQLKNNHQQNLQEKQILEEQLSTLQQQIQNKERIHEGHISQFKEELNVLRMELSSSKLENQKVKSILNERMSQLESREKELDEQLEIKSKEHQSLLREKNTLKQENMELQSVCEELMSMVEQGVDHRGTGINGSTNAYNNDTTSPSVASRSSRSSR